MCGGGDARRGDRSGDERRQVQANASHFISKRGERSAKDGWPGGGPICSLRLTPLLTTTLAFVHTFVCVHVDRNCRATVSIH